MIQYFHFFFLFGSWFDMAEKNISRTHFADWRSIKSLSWEKVRWKEVKRVLTWTYCGRVFDWMKLSIGVIWILQIQNWYLRKFLSWKSMFSFQEWFWCNSKPKLKSWTLSPAVLDLHFSVPYVSCLLKQFIKEFQDIGNFIGYDLNRLKSI